MLHWDGMPLGADELDLIIKLLEKRHIEHPDKQELKKTLDAMRNQRDLIQSGVLDLEKARKSWLDQETEQDKLQRYEEGFKKVRNTVADTRRDKFKVIDGGKE